MPAAPVLLCVVRCAVLCFKVLREAHERPEGQAAGQVSLEVKVGTARRGAAQQQQAWDAVAAAQVALKSKTLPTCAGTLALLVRLVADAVDGAAPQSCSSHAGSM